MLRTILLPTDGSAHAEVAARYAAWLARGLGAAARLLYVQDIRITSDPVMPAGYLTIPGAAPVATVTGRGGAEAGGATDGGGRRSLARD